jgi:agmatine deiminase
MPKAPNKTPAALGYSFPPEWHPHRATWFSWPRPEGISFPDKYHTVPANLAAIMREIVPREQVHINVPNGNWEYIVREQLKENGCPIDNVYFHYIKTNESWCRQGRGVCAAKIGAENRPRCRSVQREGEIIAL